MSNISSKDKIQTLEKSNSDLMNKIDELTRKIDSLIPSSKSGSNVFIDNKKTIVDGSQEMTTEQYFKPIDPAPRYEGELIVDGYGNITEDWKLIDIDGYKYYVIRDKYGRIVKQEPEGVYINYKRKLDKWINSKK